MWHCVLGSAFRDPSPWRDSPLEITGWRENWKTQTACFYENSTRTQKSGALPTHLVKARMNFKPQFLEKSSYQLPPSQPGRGKESLLLVIKRSFSLCWYWVMAATTLLFLMLMHIRCTDTWGYWGKTDILPLSPGNSQHSLPPANRRTCLHF